MGACLLFFSTTIVCCVNKKRGIDHHCRRSQVLGGTRIFSNFVDNQRGGLRISSGHRQPDSIHRPTPAPTPMDNSRRHVVDCLAEFPETHSLRSVPRVHHPGHLRGPIAQSPLTPAVTWTDGLSVQDSRLILAY